RHICALHGWDVGDIDAVRTYSVWVAQDGVNCGPAAIRSALWIFNHGLNLVGTTLRLGPGVCHHLTRLSIFVELCSILVTCQLDYRNLRAHPPREWRLTENTNDDNHEYGVDEEAAAAIESFSLDRIRSHQTFQNLRNRVIDCRDCSHAGDVFSQWYRVLQNNDPTGPILEERRQAETSVSDAEEVVEEEQAGLPSLDYFYDKPRRVGTKHKHPKSYGHLNPKRFPRPTLPIALTTYTPVWVAHQHDFDDYDSGPTKEELRGDNTDLGDVHAMYTFDPITKHILPSSWTRFADQGYRLLAGFAHMHLMNPPWKIQNHVLPLAPLTYSPAHYFTSIHQARTHQRYLKERRREKKGRGPTPPVEVFGPPDDVTFMGLEEMLDTRWGRPGCTNN
ncbi:hypothetical protein L226DRAFT_436779, partial [Lentinus tigrinus ALCF2SS1-7]|uniref:uncharacterized protein n=1 Tax=Lentinus tigrinus ALCF2SS1-7 TaxID=1328758 RepID=UPI001165EADD